MERRRRSPDGFIIALRVIGALILTTIEPWRVKDIIAETIGIGKADIKEIRTTRKRVTARIQITNSNANRKRRHNFQLEERGHPKDRSNNAQTTLRDKEKREHMDSPTTTKVKRMGKKNVRSSSPCWWPL